MGFPDQQKSWPVPLSIVVQEHTQLSSQESYFFFFWRGRKEKKRKEKKRKEKKRKEKKTNQNKTKQKTHYIYRKIFCEMFQVDAIEYRSVTSSNFLFCISTFS